MKKKMIMWIIICTLLLGMLGCASKNNGESAEPEEIIANETAESEGGNLPQKVDQSQEVDESNVVKPPEQEQPQQKPSEPSALEPEKPITDDKSTEPVIPEPDNSEDPITKLISFNVGGEDAGNGEKVAVRAPRLSQLINTHQPDLMAYQKVSASWKKYFDEHFTEFNAAEVKESGGQSGLAIYWKKDKFEVIKSGQFKLSNLSTADNTVLWVHLKEKKTGVSFLYGTTLCKIPEKDLKKSGSIIKDQFMKVGGYNGTPILLFGTVLEPELMNGWLWVDFYEECGLESISPEKYMVSHLDYNELFSSQAVCTGNYGGIDEHLLVDYLRLIDNKVNNGYVSDHYGLLMEMSLY